jgi:hypothetical protein
LIAGVISSAGCYRCEPGLKSLRKRPGNKLAKMGYK